MTYTATVVGASGFAGGELLRLLAGHPEFEVVQATSRSKTHKTVGYIHPNLRGLDLRFSSPDDLNSVDVLFSAAPHGVAMENVDRYRDAAGLVVDLSADFRLPGESGYEQWYDGHSRPELLDKAVYGLPELTRERLPGAELVAAGGCNATAVIIGLLPLVEGSLLKPDDRVVVDLKVGSSEGGTGGGDAAAHPERSGVVRPYAPTGHRHEAEIQAFLDIEVAFTAHAVGMTRGASATCHVFPDPVSRRDLWGTYREAYAEEPFVELVAGGGVYRYPEPKAVAGSNRAEVGFELDNRNERVTVFAAIDNMMKGSAGQAVQAANIALGIEEVTGLGFSGLHPVGAP